MPKKINRREFIKDCSLLTTGSLVAGNALVTSCSNSGGSQGREMEIPQLLLFLDGHSE